MLLSIALTTLKAWNLVPVTINFPCPSPIDVIYPEVPCIPDTKQCSYSGLDSEKEKILFNFFLTNKFFPKLQVMSRENWKLQLSLRRSTISRCRTLKCPSSNWNIYPVLFGKSFFALQSQQASKQASQQLVWEWPQWGGMERQETWRPSKSNQAVRFDGIHCLMNPWWRSSRGMRPVVIETFETLIALHVHGYEHKVHSKQQGEILLHFLSKHGLNRFFLQGSQKVEKLLTRHENVTLH